MMTSLAVTVMGNNQPGIINNLSATAANQGANWLKSHMAEIAGQFAGIVHLEVPTDKVESLKIELAELEKKGLVVTVADSVLPAPASAGRFLTLELVGQDHPGIVRDISQVLAAHNINIEELESECASGSMSGGTIFKASAVLNVPNSITNDELATLLQPISEGLMVDVVLDE